MKRAISVVVLVVLQAVALQGGFAQGLERLPDPGGIRTVTVLGPSWESFTNLDGTGLYHETLRKVFDLYDITVERKYVPSARALQMLSSGEGDFQTCDTKTVPPYVLARVPMYENAFHVFFNNERIGTWRGPETLKDRTVVGRIGYYYPTDFEVPVTLHEVQTGVSALGMVVLGRMDFYVDDRLLIEDTIKQSNLTFDREEFDIREVGRRPYFPVFADTERSRKILELYEAGMRRLHETGELEPVFEKWGHPYPSYDQYFLALQ